MPRKKSSPRVKIPSATSAQESGSEDLIEPAPDSNLVVGIGASAGGVEAYGALLREIPRDTQLTFVLISHLDPHHESVLADVLTSHTSMPVVQVKSDMAIRSNYVYVIPPNQEMIFERGMLRLRPRPEGRNRHLPIDTFLLSLAEDRKEKAIGVVLSGNASDGTLGLKAIKSEGGITFAQDQTAKFDSMPRSAIAEGVVDYVLPPEGIARELVRLARHPYLAPALHAQDLTYEKPLSKILHMLRHTMGVDFWQYKQPTIHRRMMRRMALHRIDRPEAYADYLKQHPDELQELYDDFLIGVTEFFRDPTSFEALKQTVFPQILRFRPGREPIRVWVPACSTGEEVYSLAISLIEFLEEYHLRYELQLFGTDVNAASIDKARTGIYPHASAAHLSTERLRRFFSQADSEYQIGRKVRDCCVFSRQDITRDPPLSRMDIVSCRNLLIYLRAASQARVAAYLHYALKPNGCLILGHSESLGSMGSYFSTLNEEHKIYCRNAAGGEPSLDLPSRIATRGSAIAVREPTDAPPFISEASEIVKLHIDRHVADHSPRTIVVDGDLKMVDIRGDIQPFLAVPARIDHPVLEVVKQDLAEPLRTAILETRAEEMPAQRLALSFRLDGEERLVDVQVLPIAAPQQRPYYLILFLNLRAPTPPLLDEVRNAGRGKAAKTIRNLEEKLASSREYLQSVIEELRSANEEVQSTNEELQSTNEELQTAKEELQASNEELRTINDEMQSRNADLSQAHNDLLNLLSSMNVPILMLDNELRVRRFTPVSEKILHLIPTDVGRPVADLKLRINLPDIEEVVRHVIETPTICEREVQDEDGRWYAMRVRPYRTTENHIEGAVLQLVDVDELKRGVDRVKRARDYAEAIVNTVREPLIVLDQAGRIRTANSSFYQTFGLSAEEAVGRPLYGVAHGKLNSPQLRELIEKVTEHRNQLQEVEIECEPDNSGLRSMVVNARGIDPDGHRGLILLAFEDVTERKQEAEARYRRLFEAAKDGILIADAETGQITDVNPFTEQLCGFSHAELVGKKLWEVEALTDVPDLPAAVARIREEGVVRFSEIPIKTKDGRIIPSEVIGNIYSEKKGRVIQFNIRNIEERKKFFRQIQESQKLESLGLLAGGIAHDFNNLLTGILGNTSLALAETPLGQASRGFLRDAIRAAEQAAHLTRQMLAYAGKGQFVTEALDISALIKEVYPLIQSSIPKLVKVHLDLLENPPAVKADRAQIQQLIMNLVINGSEAIPTGQGGSVFVRTAVRQITQQDAEHLAKNKIQPGAYLMIEVKDTGSGMDEATKSKIFDPFFTTKFTGRGLGLAAALGIVKGHRGVLRVYSTPGHGSTFTIWLPVTAEQILAPAQATRQEISDPENAIILVIDDDAIVRQVAERSLTSLGYQVLLAESGEAGARIFRENSDTISLVILDLTMPGMGGEETLKQLKSIRAEVPVFLSSGFDEMEATRRFGENDLAGFLQKPYTPQRLLTRVQAALTS